MNDGNYIAQASSTQLGFSKNDTPGIQIVFRLVESNETINTTLWLSEKAQERTRDTLRLMGFTGNDISVFYDASEAECANILPNNVEIVIETEEYENERGELRNSQKIKWINAIGSSSIKQMERGQTAAFAARFKGLFAGGKPPAPRQQQAPKSSSPKLIDQINEDDENPFNEFL